MTLYHEYFPYLRKSKNYLPSCSDEYLQDGNIRLLFGYFINDYTEEELKNPTIYDLIYSSEKYDNDYAYSKISPNYYKENEWNYANDANIINTLYVNKNINGSRKNNFEYIALNPFGNKPNDVSEEEFKEKEIEFLSKQINILTPNSIIIACQVRERNDDLDIDEFKKIFGNDIIIYPIQFPPKFIEKYEWESEYSHLSLIEGIKNFNIPVYIFKWDMYDQKDYVMDFLEILSNHIKKSV